MKSLNKITLIGNTTNVPELKHISQGTAVCNFSVATNREWKDASGQKVDEATFHRVVAWGKLGEVIAQYLGKGSKVYIEGRISNRSWTDTQGVKKYMTEVVAEEVIFLDNKGGNVTQDAPPEPEPVSEPKPTDEEEVNIDDILGLDSFDGNLP